MQIDIIWLRENFQKLNKLYFDGVLPTPRFRIGRSRTRLGSLSYKKPEVASFTLSMSNYYDQTECQFLCVLLHEMIHLSIAASGLKDTSSHGVIFRGMMARLNREGWNISVTTPMRGTPKAYTGSDTIIKNYLVLAIEMKDGKHFLSSVNPRFARKLNTQLKRISAISRFAWYTTNDRQFEDWPKVRSLRGRKVDEAAYKKFTTSSHELALSI